MKRVIWHYHSFHNIHLNDGNTSEARWRERFIIIEISLMALTAVGSCYVSALRN